MKGHALVRDGVQDGEERGAVGVFRPVARLPMRAVKHLLHDAMRHREKEPREGADRFMGAFLGRARSWPRECIRVLLLWSRVAAGVSRAVLPWCRVRS